MKHRVKEAMKEQEVTREVIAERMNVHPVTVSKLISSKGKMRMTLDWLQRFADALNLPIRDLLAGADTGEVPLVGYVGAGAEAHFYGEGQGPFGMVPAPEDATAETVAVEVRGDSLGALFDRWIVFYDEVKQPITADLIGRLCVVGLADDRVLVKKIQRSREPGFYHLLSNTEAPILDVVITWAAKVKSMVPQ